MFFCRSILDCINENSYRSIVPHRSPGPPNPIRSFEPAAPVASPTPRIRSEQLLGGGNELVIEHHGREYRLRVTRNGKLILTA